MFRKQSQTRGNMTGFVNEMLGNIKVVKVFDHGEKAQEEFDQINDDLAYYSLRATFFSHLSQIRQPDLCIQESMQGLRSQDV